MKKKIVNLISLAGIIAAPVAVGVVYFQANSAVGVVQTQKAITRTNFPLKKPLVINFDTQEGFDQLTNRQQLDQLRDWLLLTVVSGKGISTQDINNSTYDLPTVRYDYVSPVANFEYGTTRSVYLSEGRVIALVPKNSSEAERKDDLAHIADRHRKDQGKQPKIIEVYEYEITPDKQSALLTRLPELDAAKLFSNEYGYYETTIQNLEGLNNFLNQVNDLSFAEVNGSSLRVGGRKIFSRQYQGIRAEDIAALWKSDNNNTKGSGFSLDPGFDYVSLTKALDQSQPVLQSLKLNGKPVITDQDIQKAKAGLSREDIVPYRKLIDKLKNLTKSNKGKQAFAEGDIPDEIKRELKPLIAKKKQDFDAQVKSYENQLRQQLKDKVQSWQLSGLSNTEIQQKIDAEKPQINQKFYNFQKQINEQNKNELRQIIDKKIQAKITEINHFLDSPEKLGYQAARYDGDLKGTEVGMVLFYTDLLAKLWALNYVGTTPTAVIPDFNPLTKVKVSSIYKEEIEKLSHTRLWFGSQDKGFQVANDGNNLLFARNATRIYAASSDPLKPGQETTAAADTNTFLSWWNDHYEEVARHEQQYERLNQIMKWSLVINWLNQSNRSNTLGFLQNISVKRDNWFSDWVKDQGTNLKFQQWKKIDFYPRNYKGIKTEAMPILASEKYQVFGRKQLFKGGVSLPNQKTFQERTSLPASRQLNEVGFPSNIDPQSINLQNGKLTFKNLEGTTFKVENPNPNLSKTIAQAKPEARFRSPEAELTNQTFTRKVTQVPNRIEVQTTVGDTPFGNLNINKTGNGFKVGFKSRDIDSAHNISWRLSKEKGDIITQLKGMDEVETVMLSSSQPDEFIVKLSDSDDWVSIKQQPPGGSGFGGKGGGKEPPNTQMLLGFPEENSRDLRLAWIKDETVKQKQLAGEFRETFRRDNHLLKEASYRPNSEEILQPLLFIKKAKTAKAARIQKIDELLINGKDKKAASLIDDSVNYFGADPDLMLRRAFVDIRRNRMVVSEVTSRGVKVPQGKEKILDQFQRMLVNKKAHFRRFENNTEFIYIQDSPELNNLDPAQPIEQSIPFSSGVRVYKLEPGKVGDVKISQSGFGDVTASSHPATKVPGGGGRGPGDPRGPRDPGGPGDVNPQKLLYVPYSGLPLTPACTEQDQDDQQETKDNKQNKNCLEEKRLEEKPVYLIIKSDNN